MKLDIKYLKTKINTVVIRSHKSQTFKKLKKQRKPNLLNHLQQGKFYKINSYCKRQYKE